MKGRVNAYRLVALVTLLVFLGSFLACGGSAPSTQSTQATTQPSQTGTAAKTTTSVPASTQPKTTAGGKTTQVATIFKDPALDNVIRDALAQYGEPIACGDVGGITQISGARQSIKDLTGIECCTGTNQIYLDSNQLVDITPVGKLTQLTRLYMWQNQIKDISPLAGLVELRGLSAGNNVQDISVVGKMVHLTALTLNGPFSDLSPLANLPDLTTLNIEDSNVSDITVLAKLTNLTRVYLTNCPVTDIKPLVDNPGMKTGAYIKLSGCPLSDKSKNEYIPQLTERGVLITP